MRWGQRAGQRPEHGGRICIRGLDYILCMWVTQGGTLCRLAAGFALSTDWSGYCEERFEEGVTRWGHQLACCGNRADESLDQMTDCRSTFALFP